jgi:hypothetical protein
MKQINATCHSISPLDRPMYSIFVTSWDEPRYGQTLGRRQYLNEVAGRGPGPRRHGGAVTAPRRRGRYLPGS